MMTGRYVYLIGSENLINGEMTYKIGSSNNPLQRFKAVKKTQYDELQMLAYFCYTDLANFVERKAHMMFRHLTDENSDGIEWFKLTASDKTALRNLFTNCGGILDCDKTAQYPRRWGEVCEIVRWRQGKTYAHALLPNVEDAELMFNFREG